ncbi:zinc finger protein 28-like [Malaya genurostris]|uniref:zinc finger protein 28-like n=1 Tax=Malaya genurostris TaxID=325434 RepID=UPI0026F3AADF|nr:zinc finger protein 28-like [Malaya genurostris]
MSLETICRMCSSQKSRLRSLFHDYTIHQMLNIIEQILHLKMEENDGLPSNICKPCATNILRLNEMVNRFRENERKLRRKILGTAFSDKQEIDTIIELNVKQTDKTAEQILNEEKKDVLQVFEDKLITEGKDLQTSKAVLQQEIVEHSESKLLPGIVHAKSKISSYPSRRRLHRDPNRPKLHDHKCYICKSESMGSAKALLEHLSVHLDLTPYTCNECVMETIVLRNVRSLNLHKKMHAQPIKCEYCDRRYSDLWAREGHIKAHHLGESVLCPSICEQCGKVCKSITALKSHMRDHKLNLRCGYCDKMFHRQNKLFRHVSRVHEKAEKYECNLCKHIVHSLESYNAHLKMHNAEKSFSCDLCPMTFCTSGNLGLHKKAHAKNVNYKPRKDWTNHYTVLSTSEGDKSYSCNHCSSTYSGTINAIISHVKCHFKDLKCDQCDLKFTNAHKLKTHYVVHTRERNFKCEFCEKDFLYRTHMNHHIKQKHKSKDDIREQNSS